jgi:hypothetical protein
VPEGDSIHSAARRTREVLVGSQIQEETFRQWKAELAAAEASNEAST